MNNVDLIGRLTFEPELKTTPNGVSVCSFQMAVERKYTPKNEEKQSDFIDCVAWRQTAEFICRNFHKGNRIAVDGALQTRNYTDKDGNKRKVVEVVVDNVYFCDGKSNTASTAQTKPSIDINEDDPANGFVVTDENDDGLPF